jgi:hypothetical protein
LEFYGERVPQVVEEIQSLIRNGFPRDEIVCLIDPLTFRAAHHALAFPGDDYEDEYTYEFAGHTVYVTNDGPDVYRFQAALTFNGWASFRGLIPYWTTCLTSNSKTLSGVLPYSHTPIPRLAVHQATYADLLPTTPTHEGQGAAEAAPAEEQRYQWGDYHAEPLTGTQALGVPLPDETTVMTDGNATTLTFHNGSTLNILPGDEHHRGRTIEREDWDTIYNITHPGWDITGELGDEVIVNQYDGTSWRVSPMREFLLSSWELEHQPTNALEQSIYDATWPFMDRRYWEWCPSDAERTSNSIQLDPEDVAVQDDFLSEFHRKES